MYKLTKGDRKVVDRGNDFTDFVRVIKILLLLHSSLVLVS